MRSYLPVLGIFGVNFLSAFYGKFLHGFFQKIVFFRLIILINSVILRRHQHNTWVFLCFYKAF